MTKEVETKEDGRTLIYYSFAPASTDDKDEVRARTDGTDNASGEKP